MNRVADFHSLRHLFITRLVAAGVHLKDAKELARHSTSTLTIDRYSHVELADNAAAIARMSPISSPSACNPLVPLPGVDCIGMMVADGITNPSPAGVTSSERLYLMGFAADLPDLQTEGEGFEQQRKCLENKHF
ncbi:MAG: hypothetical protein LC104_19165 [Bacteroidales bacterium]|nr:hypothetical protein [Bacteroidales bacterium]